jgi:hypothetical protein
MLSFSWVFFILSMLILQMTNTRNHNNNVGDNNGENNQRLEEEKATLEGMVESHDELLMEIARETGLDHMGVDDEDEEEEEGGDNGEDAAAPPAAAPPPPAPLLPRLRRSTVKAWWRWSLIKKPQCRMKSS